MEPKLKKDVRETAETAAHEGHEKLEQAEVKASELKRKTREHAAEATGKLAEKVDEFRGDQDAKRKQALYEEARQKLEAGAAGMRADNN